MVLINVAHAAQEYPSTTVNDTQRSFTNMGGDLLLTLNREVTLAEARKAVSEQLAVKGTTGVWIEFTKDERKIIDEGQFTDVTGNILCYIVSLSEQSKLDARESFNWCKQQDPASRTQYEVMRSGRHIAPMENSLYEKITGTLDTKLLNLSKPDFEKYITHFLAAYADILCKNISEKKLIRPITPALIRCKTKYDIQAVVPISSRTPENYKACTSMQDIIENSVNRVIESGESSIEGEMDKFRKFLAENKNVLFQGYADDLVKSGSDWCHTLQPMIGSTFSSNRTVSSFDKFDKQKPIGKLYNEMSGTLFIYEQLLLTRPALSY